MPPPSHPQRYVPHTPQPASAHTRACQQASCTSPKEWLSYGSSTFSKARYSIIPFNWSQSRKKMLQILTVQQQSSQVLTVLLRNHIHAESTARPSRRGCTSSQALHQGMNVVKSISSSFTTVRVPSCFEIKPPSTRPNSKNPAPYDAPEPPQSQQRPDPCTRQVQRPYSRAPPRSGCIV